MAFLSNRINFPDFEQSKNYFLTGLGGPPATTIAEDFGAPGGGGATAPATGVGEAAAPTTPAAPPPPAAPPAAPTVPAAPPAAETYTPPTLGYGDPGKTGGGGLYGQLVDPVAGAAQAGSADVMSFADQFRSAAGPARTYEGIGAEGTLSGAVEGAPLEPAFDLVNAQYQGPAGLDPTGVAGLGFLQGQLETREKALGTGAGLTSSIGQTVQTLTPGEARFEAEAMFDPAYRAALATDLAPVGQFAGELGTETQAAADFAAQRAAQEADIAAKSTDYLTTRGEGITGNIEQQIQDILAQQQGASQAFSGALDTEDPAAMIEALRKAQESGFTGGEDLAGGFSTEAFQASQGAEANTAAIMGDAKYADLKDVPQGQLGIGSHGRQTYMIPDAQGNLVDFRTVLGKTELAQLFKERQGALEEAFGSQRGVSFPGGKTSGDYFGAPTGQQLTNPLYFGEEFQGPEIASYLGFEPGFRPSRENVSSDQQRDQYNRIQTLIGNLDRMSEDKENPWKFAMITANLEGYIEDEIAGLEKQGDTLSKEGKEWFGMVKKARKAYRNKKAWKKYKAYGKIGKLLAKR
ncbi:MAG: hypothetical protein KAJ42_15390 [Gemmatimonadetes bacterium]|nr:hypothetical protein [Gemmatimonadota bacterium]